MDEHVTLDNWKPREKLNTVIKSQWRTEANHGHFDNKPGLDEIRKIKMNLNRNKLDHEIMQSFGIDATILAAIKDDHYDPVDGITLNNQSKIYKAFKELEDKIINIYKALNMLSDNAFPKKDTSKRLMFKSLIKVAKKKSVTLEEEDDEDEIE